MFRQRLLQPECMTAAGLPDQLVLVGECPREDSNLHVHYGH